MAVPRVPGVPPLSSFSPLNVVLLTADVIGVLGIFAAPQWGIFLDGEQQLPLAGLSPIGFSKGSTVSVGYKREWAISDYQVEQGGFQTYNKVQRPFESRVRVSSGPFVSDRAALIAALDEIGDSLDLYDVVTPEKVYRSVNVTHVDYDRRADRGAGIIVADVWFVEVRVTATTQFSSTASPTAAGEQSSGAVQPQAPPDSLTQKFNSGGGPTQMVF